MKVFLAAALAVVAFSALPAMAQQLDSVKVHVGMADLEAIVSGEKKLPLIEPAVATEPAFDPEIKSYRVRMPYGVDGVTLVVESGFMNEFGIVDFNGVGEGFKSVTYDSNMRMAKGAILPFRLEPGDNRLRLAAKHFTTTVIYDFFIERPAAAAGNAALTSLQIGGGDLSPAFDSGTRTYRTRLVGRNNLRVTPTPSAGSSVIVLGTTADGAALEVNGDRVSGLTAGDNTIALVVQAEDGTHELYTLIANLTLSGDTTLAALELANGELSPPFDPDTRAYRTRIVGNGLTVTSTPNPNASVTMLGTAADGGALQVEGGSASGLTAGENTVSIAVRAQDGTSGRYTLIAEVSDDIRALRKGDEISRQSDCDSDTGCDGTLNGVGGRFACSGVDLRSESTNLRFSVQGMCLLSTNEGVVTNVVGWYFAAFPASPL